MKPHNAALLPTGTSVFVISNNRVQPARIVAAPTRIVNETFVHVKYRGAIETVSADRVFLDSSDAVTALNSITAATS